MLNALEKNRTYSYNNYYQNGNLPNIPEITNIQELHKQTCKKLWDLKQSHKKEVIELQKQITQAQKFVVGKQEVETQIEYDWSLSVNCPYCDRWQEVDTSDYDHEGDYEANQECEHCTKIFSVKATR